MEDKISKGSNYETKGEHDNSGSENFVHPPFKISGSAPAFNSSYIYLTPLEMQVQHLKWFHVFYTFMYLSYFLSLYQFAVPKPDFLYKTASLQ